MLCEFENVDSVGEQSEVGGEMSGQGVCEGNVGELKFLWEVDGSEVL